MLRKVLFLSLFLTPIVGSAQVEVLWEASTYTPPFYLGKALWSNESRITFTAIPHLPNASSLIYRWSRDGTILGASSGVNRRTLSFADTALSMSTQVKVEVLTLPDTEPIASDTVFLRPGYVRLLSYEDNPLYGLMLHNALGGTFPMAEPEASFAAVPLYGQVSTRVAPAYTYTWTTNTLDTRSGNKVTYRAPEGESGTSAITLKAVNSRVLIQPETKNFQITFSPEDNF